MTTNVLTGPVPGAATKVPNRENSHTGWTNPRGLDKTFYRWRLKYGALKEDEAQRLKALEQENARLKRIVAEQALDISMLKDLQKGNW